MSKVQVDLYAAVSADGFIARENGDTDWVADDELFEQTCKAYACVVMGRATFEEFGGPPFDGVQWLVLSSNGRPREYKDVRFVNSARQAIDKAKAFGDSKLLIIGGAKTNRSFMEAGAVQKIMLDIHPLVLGGGIRLLGDYNGPRQLTLTSNETMSVGFTHLEYNVAAS